MCIFQSHAHFNRTLRSLAEPPAVEWLQLMLSAPGLIRLIQIAHSQQGILLLHDTATDSSNDEVQLVKARKVRSR
jgi:hypothetical protein